MNKQMDKETYYNEKQKWNLVTGMSFKIYIYYCLLIGSHPVVKISYLGLVMFCLLVQEQKQSHAH